MLQKCFKRVVITCKNGHSSMPTFSSLICNTLRHQQSVVSVAKKHQQTKNVIAILVVTKVRLKRIELKRNMYDVDLSILNFL
jgi:hypothetical protein